MVVLAGGDGFGGLTWFGYVCYYVAGKRKRKWNEREKAKTRVIVGCLSAGCHGFASGALAVAGARVFSCIIL